MQKFNYMNFQLVIYSCICYYIISIFPCIYIIFFNLYTYFISNKLKILDGDYRIKYCMPTNQLKLLC